jgi:hypothetical protein
LRNRKVIESKGLTAGIQYSDVDRRTILRRRTKEHVVNLQVKQGKPPAYDDVEDALDEKMLIPRNARCDNQPKSMPVILKIPTSVPPAEDLFVRRSSRKEEVDTEEEEEEEDILSQHTQGTSISYATRHSRRASPDVELSKFFEQMISDLISIPDAWPFCRPVSSSLAPDYYDIIKNPKTLEQIRDVSAPLATFAKTHLIGHMP